MFGSAEFREDRHTQDLGGELVGNRQDHGRQVREALLAVQRQGIIDFRADPGLNEVLPEGVAFAGSRHAQRELVPDMRPPGMRGGPNQALPIRHAGQGDERFAISGGMTLPRGAIGWQVRQLHAQQGALQGIEPEISADDGVKILGLGAVRPQ